MTSVPIFPVMQLRDKMFSIGSALDGHDLKEEGSEIFGIGAFGIAPTPHEPLSLDVNQATLNQDPRPQQSQDPHQMRITIDSSAYREQSRLL